MHEPAVLVPSPQEGGGSETPGHPQCGHHPPWPLAPQVPLEEAGRATQPESARGEPGHAVNLSRAARAPPRDFGDRDRFSAVAFGCFQRHRLAFTAARGGPAVGHTRGGPVPGLSRHGRKSPGRGSGDRRRRLCWQRCPPLLSAPDRRVLGAASEWAWGTEGAAK